MREAGAVSVEGHSHNPPRLFRGEAEAALFHRRGECLPEGALHGRERDAVLRALRPGETWGHCREVQLQRLAVLGVRALVGAEDSLLLAVALDSLHFFFAAARLPQVAQRFHIHREKSHRCTVSECHL